MNASNIQQVHCSHFMIDRTYAGSMEGLPPRKFILRHITEKIKKNWGERATFIFEPEEERFPKWTYIAWLSGPAKKDENDGAELVVVWFSNEMNNLFLTDMLSRVDWNKAKDFCY